MSMSSDGNKGVGSEINVTPLIDVLLVLLIIFMVIQPTTISGLDTLIPQPPKSPDRAQLDHQPIVVQVFADGKHGATYKINETSFDKADIEPELAGIFATRNDKVMFVKGDADLDFSAVAEIIEYGHQAGVDNVGIITPQASAAQE